MKKVSLLFVALLMSVSFFAQSTIPVDQYGNVLLSDYESYANNQKVTVILSVNSDLNSSVAPGWGIGTIKPINSGSEIPAAYNFSCKAVASGGAVNAYDFTIADFKEFAKVGGEYYVDSYDQKGLTINVYNGASIQGITVSAAEVAGSVLNFESDELGAEYTIISCNPSPTPDDATATVEARPGGEGKALHIVNKQWNTYPQFLVNLPEGKKLSDVEKITLELYFEDAPKVDGQTQNDYKGFRYFFGEKEAVFTSLDASKLLNNFIAGSSANPLKTWLKKDFVPDLTAQFEGFASLSTFEFGFGLHINASGNYFMDNITFIMKEGSGIIIPKNSVNNSYVSNSVLFLGAQTEKIAIYDVNGRLLKSGQNVSSVDLANLTTGIYIAKIITGNQAQTIKFAK